MEQFVFFRTYWEAAKMLPDEQRHELLEAIMKYVFEDSFPQPESPIMPLFILTEPTLSKSKRASDAKRTGTKQGADGIKNKK